MISNLFHCRPAAPGGGKVPFEGAHAEQHARIHEGVRDHAVHRARQHRAPLRRGRLGDLADPPHHRARATALSVGMPEGVVSAVHLQRSRPF